MTLAMMIGMATLGWALRGAIEMISAGALRNVEVSVLAMALSMSIPMIIWMRHRGHAWVSTLEMSAGMIVPAVALLAALRMDAMLGSTALALQHGLMMPTMIGVMLWRHSEYLH